MAKAKPLCFTCGAPAHYAGVYGETHSLPSNRWSRGIFCYYCKSIIDQMTLFHVMWTRLPNPESRRDATAAIAQAKRLLKKARKMK